MKHKLQRIKEESQLLCSDISSELQTAQDHLNQIGVESHRVIEISKAPMVIINEIDSQFEKATKLTKADIAFLFLAAALQCVRQYALTIAPERLGDKEAADAVKKKGEHSERKHRYYNPTLDEIVRNPVPFDANMGSGKYRALGGFGYLGHRGATPGHDPIIGLVIGTANIATSTLTNWRWESYHIYTGTIGNARGNREIFKARAQTPLVLSHTSDKLLHQGIDGKEIVGVSVLKEITHLRSDVYSKDSLPLPAISLIDPKIAGELAKHGFDMASMINVGKQFTYAVLIDTLIALIHSLFYNESDGISRNMFEVRTRRILLYSNLIASASNVVVSAISLYTSGAAGARVIDWGGYLNTLRHLVFDTKFIHEVKKDFLKNELYTRIVGQEYDFMKGDF